MTWMSRIRSIADAAPAVVLLFLLAVATHRVCQPRQESLFERNAAS